MSSGEVVYQVRVAYPDYLQRGRAQVATLPLYLDGALAPPTDGTFTLTSPGGVVVVDAGTVVVTDDIATYPLLAGDIPVTLALGHGYKEDWTLTCADGVERTFRRDAAVVLYAAYPVVTDADLVAVYSDLARQLRSGTTTFTAYIDEAWKRILGRLESQGVFPEHVVTSWSLREVHCELALHLVCLDCARAQGGRWMDLAVSHKKEFELAWNRLRFVKSTSGDGLADSDAMRAANKGVTHMNSSPRSTWSGSWGL